MAIEAPVFRGRPTRFAFLKDYILAAFLFASVLAVRMAGLYVYPLALYAAIALAVIFIIMAETARLSNSYCVTPSQVIVQEGIVSSHRYSVFMDNISDVNVRQSRLQRLLGYGRVIIGSSSGREHMQLKMVARNPQKTAHSIERLIHEYAHRKK